MDNLTQKLFIFTALNIRYSVVRLKQLDPMYQKVYFFKNAKVDMLKVEKNNLMPPSWIYGLPRWHSGEESVCQCRR